MAKNEHFIEINSNNINKSSINFCINNSNTRIIQKQLVYVIGLSYDLAFKDVNFIIKV